MRWKFQKESSLTASSSPPPPPQRPSLRGVSSESKSVQAQRKVSGENPDRFRQRWKEVGKKSTQLLFALKASHVLERGNSTGSTSNEATEYQSTCGKNNPKKAHKRSGERRQKIFKKREKNVANTFSLVSTFTSNSKETTKEREREREK